MYKHESDTVFYKHFNQENRRNIRGEGASKFMHCHRQFWARYLLLHIFTQKWEKFGGAEAPPKHLLVNGLAIGYS